MKPKTVSLVLIIAVSFTLFACGLFSTQTPMPTSTSTSIPKLDPRNPVTISGMQLQITSATVSDRFVVEEDVGEMYVMSGALEVDLMLDGSGFVPENITAGQKVLTVVSESSEDNMEEIAQWEVWVTQDDSSPIHPGATLLCEGGVIWVFVIETQESSINLFFSSGEVVDLEPLLQ